MQFEIFEETSLSENNIKLRNCEKLRNSYGTYPKT